MEKLDSRRSKRSLYSLFPRSRSMFMLVAVAIVVVAVVGVIVAGCGSSSNATSTTANVTSTTVAQGSSLTTAGGGTTSTAVSTTGSGNATSGTTTPTVAAQGEASPAEAVAQILGPSVVNVQVTGTTTVSNGLGQFGFPQQEQTYEAEGSGIIYRSDGMIITNNHVVVDENTGDPVSKIVVTLATGEKLNATIVGRDPLTDIAVIKVTTDKKLPVAQFVSTLPKVGEYAIAIGSPLGYENSVTLGIVSGLSREIEGVTGAEAAAYTNLIQTDAPISPGNSGGALANASGQVIGINVAYEPPNETGAVSIGFAIPASTALNVADQLINSGKVTQGYLGVGLYPDALSSDLQQQFGLSRSSGVLVSEVVSGGPAAKAGLEQGDIIFKANGQDVTDPGIFTALIRDAKPGSQMQLTFDRKGQDQTVTVTIAERPSTTTSTTSP